MAHPGTRRSRLHLFVLTSLLFHAACNDDDAGTARDCPAEVDDLLVEVDRPAPGRRQCGAFNSGYNSAVAEALDCLLLPDEGASTELTVTRCEDCSVLSTYVVTSEGDMLHVFREADHFGDDRREVAVERCSDIVAHPTAAIECVAPKQLFSCEDALPQ